VVTQSEAVCGTVRKLVGHAVVSRLFSLSDTQTRATSKLPVKSKDAEMLRHLHTGGLEPDVTKVTKPRRENG